MPVSKKRKKEGKPVKRYVAPAAETGAEHPELPPSHPRPQMGKPTNPFVAGRAQAHRGSQRGR